MIKDYIKKYRYVISLSTLLVIVCSMHILFLAQMDYVVYDHDQWRTGRVAIDGYWLLKDGRLKDFVSGMFSPWHYNVRYPNLVGYLVAIPSYFFGLNEVVMRIVILLFYIILILYIYLCGKALDSKKTGVLACLIAVTIPTLVFWSRMINTNFLGALLFTMAFYHMLMSRTLHRFGHSLLFGLFGGLALLIHRVMFFYIITLWITVTIYYITTRNKTKSSTGNYFLALILIFGTSAFYVAVWVYKGEPGQPFSFYGFPFNRIKNAVYTICALLGELGWDNVFVLIGIVIFQIFKKGAFKEKNISLLFHLLIILFGALTAFYCIRPGYSIMHFAIITPMIAILAAIYLNKVSGLLRGIFIFMKCLLIVYLSLVIIPHFSGKDIANIFYKYYRNTYRENGNGVIWSNMTYAREEELDYFRKEIREGDIAIIDLSNGIVSVPLGFRLKINGIGRSIGANGADIKALYLMFYCAPFDDLEKCQDGKARRDWGKENNPLELSVVEKFLNNNVSRELRPNERIVMIDGHIFLSELKNLIEKYHFVKTKIFKFRFKNVPMYKVVFKCTESTPELISFRGYGNELCLLRDARKYSKAIKVN